MINRKIKKIKINKNSLAFISSFLILSFFIICFFPTSSLVSAQTSGDIMKVADSAPRDKYLNVFSGQTIFSFIVLIFKFVINYFAAPALILALVYSGFLFIKAQGNEQELKEAKKFAKGVLVGIVVVAATSLIINVLLKTLTDTSKAIGVNNNKSSESVNSNVNTIATNNVDNNTNTSNTDTYSLENVDTTNSNTTTDVSVDTYSNINTTKTNTNTKITPTTEELFGYQDNGNYNSRDIYVYMYDEYKDKYSFNPNGEIVSYKIYSKDKKLENEASSLNNFLNTFGTYSKDGKTVKLTQNNILNDQYIKNDLKNITDFYEIEFSIKFRAKPEDKTMDGVYTKEFNFTLSSY